MLYSYLADLVLVVHFSFVAFVALGGFLVLRWPNAAWLHVPAAVWGVAIEYSGAVCPLTPLEIEWRRRGGEAGYPGGFLDHYVTAVIYPEGLTRAAQMALGTLVLVANLAIYAYVIARRRHAANASAN